MTGRKKPISLDLFSFVAGVFSCSIALALILDDAEKYELVFPTRIGIFMGVLVIASIFVLFTCVYYTAYHEVKGAPIKTSHVPVFGNLYPALLSIVLGIGITVAIYFYR